MGGITMKKVWIVLLSLCLMGTAIAAAPAEEEAAELKTEPVEQVIDLSGYDNDTLVALLKQVQGEIVARHIEKTASLRAGTYIFGEDIPAGKYILTKSAQAQDSGKVGLFAADETVDDTPSKLYHYISEDEDYEAYIIAEEGDWMILQVPCDLTISPGVVFQ